MSNETHDLINRQMLALLNPVRNAINFTPFYFETELKEPLTEGSLRFIPGGEGEIPIHAADEMKAKLLEHGIHVEFPESTDQNSHMHIRIKLRMKETQRIAYKTVAPWYVELYCSLSSTSAEVAAILRAVTKANESQQLVFRGETELYPSVRSTMARYWNTNSAAALDIMVKSSLQAARRYLPKEQHDDLSVSAVIQHMGGKTNLVDFSSEAWVALFFACLDARKRPILENTGRVYALDMEKNHRQMEFHLLTNRQSPVQQERWKNQHSVAVIPPNGVISPGSLTEVARIPSSRKEEVNQFLDNIQISTRTLFNDIEGYITYEQETTPIAALCHIAMQHIENGAYLAAFAIGESLIQLDRTDQEIGHYILGLCNATQGNLRKAEGYINEYVKIRKNKGVPDYVRQNLRTIQRALQKNKNADYDSAAEQKIRRLRKHLCLDIDENLWSVSFGPFTIVD